MVPEDNLQFQLSIWRPAQLGRPLNYAPEKDEGAPRGVAFDSGRLHEEIYHWNPGQEDVWGGIQDSAACRELRDQFVEGFSPSLSPEQRSMERFRESIEKLRTYLSVTDHSNWADLMQTVKVRGSEPVNLRGNAAMSLLHHLEWIARTFETLPGASVTIR
jgi:hypothetical protein